MSGTSLTNLTILNSGTITAGSGSVVGCGFIVGYTSGTGGNAISVNSGNASGVVINNSAIILGGKGGNAYGRVGSGGDSGWGAKGELNLGGGGGSGGSVVVGGGGGVWGVSAGGYAGNGGSGVSLSCNNVTINNSGSIIGGDAGARVFDSDLAGGGSGITAVGDNVTINTSGTISAGGGQNPPAIVLNGNNNTINLLGNSAVHGAIVATGSNNVLNFALSDISPSQALVIKNNVTAQEAS